MLDLFNIPMLRMVSQDNSIKNNKQQTSTDKGLKLNMLLFLINHNETCHHLKISSFTLNISYILHVISQTDSHNFEIKSSSCVIWWLFCNIYKQRDFQNVYTNTSQRKIIFEAKVLVQFLMKRMSDASSTFYSYFSNSRMRIPTEWEESEEHSH